MSIFKSIREQKVKFIEWRVFIILYSIVVALQLIYESSYLISLSELYISNQYFYVQQLIFIILFVFSIFFMCFNKKFFFSGLLCSFFYFCFRWPSSSLGYHYDIAPIFVFIIFALSGLEKESNNMIPAWPTYLIRFYLGLIYLSAGSSKIINSGLSWITGESIKYSFLLRSLEVESDLPLHFANSQVICIVISVLTLIFELFFWTINLLPKYKFLYLIAGLIFHTTIFLSMGLNFSFYFGPMYLVLIPYRKVIILSRVMFKKARRLSVSF